MDPRSLVDLSNKLAEMDPLEEKVIEYNQQIASELGLSENEKLTWQQRSKSLYGERGDAEAWGYTIRDFFSYNLPLTQHVGAAVRPLVGDKIAGSEIKPSAVMQKLKKITDSRVKNLSISEKYELTEEFEMQDEVKDMLNVVPNQKALINELKRLYAQKYQELLNDKDLREVDFLNFLGTLSKLDLSEANNNKISLPDVFLQQKVIPKPADDEHKYGPYRTKYINHFATPKRFLNYEIEKAKKISQYRYSIARISVKYAEDESLVQRRAIEQAEKEKTEGSNATIIAVSAIAFAALGYVLLGPAGALGGLILGGIIADRFFTTKFISNNEKLRNEQAIKTQANQESISSSTSKLQRTFTKDNSDVEAKVNNAESKEVPITKSTVPKEEAIPLLRLKSQ